MIDGTDVRVSYLTMSSGPVLWGTVGSLVTTPGQGRWVLLRRLVPERGGPQGYFVVDLVNCTVMGGEGAWYDTEAEARAAVAKYAEAGQ